MPKMKNYKNKYRGFTIHVTEINADRVDYKVTKEGATIEDSEGYCVTVNEAMDTCKEIIDDSIGD